MFESLIDSILGFEGKKGAAGMPSSIPADPIEQFMGPPPQDQGGGLGDLLSIAMKFLGAGG